VNAGASNLRVLVNFSVRITVNWLRTSSRGKATNLRDVARGSGFVQSGGTSSGMRWKIQIVGTGSSRRDSDNRETSGWSLGTIKFNIIYIMRSVRREALGGSVSIGLTTTQVGLSQ
jgi:hypothetical protein